MQILYYVTTTLLSAILLTGSSDARPRSISVASAAASAIYAEVVLYDATPGQEAALERELTAQIPQRTLLLMASSTIEY